jgi:hypothetical protein
MWRTRIPIDTILRSSQRRDRRVKETRASVASFAL